MTSPFDARVRVRNATTRRDDCPRMRPLRGAARDEGRPPVHHGDHRPSDEDAPLPRTYPRAEALIDQTSSSLLRRHQAGSAISRFGARSAAAFARSASRAIPNVTGPVGDAPETPRRSCEGFLLLVLLRAGVSLPRRFASSLAVTPASPGRRALVPAVAVVSIASVFRDGNASERRADLFGVIARSRRSAGAFRLGRELLAPCAGPRALLPDAASWWLARERACDVTRI